MTSRKIFLKINNLSKKFTNHTGFWGGQKNSRIALDNISLEIFEGERLAIVGESGSGKTTLGRCILRFEKPDTGEIIYNQKNLLHFNNSEFRKLRSKLQMIFQDSFQAFNPILSVKSCLTEALKMAGIKKQDILIQINKLLSQVGLSTEIMHRYPGQLSGGQRQRLAIARALALKPSFIIADEPTSSLDAIHKKKIINLIIDIQRTSDLTLLLISHDLGLISNAAERILIMFGGNIVEMAPTKLILKSPIHPYTRLLLNFADDRRDPDNLFFKKEVEKISSLNNKGCIFLYQCPVAQPLCKLEKPVLNIISDEHKVACHFHDQNSNTVKKKNKSSKAIYKC